MQCRTESLQIELLSDFKQDLTMRRALVIQKLDKSKLKHKKVKT